MPRIRTIKPEFFDDEDLCALPPLCRLAFIGLWCQADKAGRFEDRPVRLKARIFPFDAIDMEATLAELAKAGFILRYVVDGKRYACIKPASWQKHQRPRNDELESTLPPAVTVHSDELVTAQCLGKERKGKEVEGNGTDDPLRERFERFWAEYPRKVGKDAAWREFCKHRPGDDLADAMIRAVQTQRASAQWRRDGGQYIPHPRTWLHQGRWQDDDAPASAQRTNGHWFDECKQLHGGACSKRWDHEMRMRG